MCLRAQKKFLRQFFASVRPAEPLLDDKSTKKISCDAKTKMFLSFASNWQPAAPGRWRHKKREKISLCGARMKYFSIPWPAAARSGSSWTLGRYETDVLAGGWLAGILWPVVGDGLAEKA